MGKQSFWNHQHIAMTQDALAIMISSFQRPIQLQLQGVEINSDVVTERKIASSSTTEISPQFALAMELLGKRWTWLILCTLMNGDCRFVHFSAVIPQISDRMLAQRLKELEAYGLIQQHVCQRPYRCEYHLTKKGKALLPVLEQIQLWAHNWIE